MIIDAQNQEQLSRPLPTYSDDGSLNNLDTLGVSNTQFQADNLQPTFNPPRPTPFGHSTFQPQESMVFADTSFAKTDGSQMQALPVTGTLQGHEVPVEYV